jgi:LmbE family N-acetylglucosaminyl deacetylase
MASLAEHPRGATSEAHEPAWRAAHVLRRWCEASGGPRAPRVLVFAAHPDDDVLGLGGRLHDVAPDMHIAIVSDGAPDAPSYYCSLGFRRREDYAQARRAEAQAALRRAGVPEQQLHELGLIDQTVARHLDVLIERVRALVAAVSPDAVMTHPYEGGHPDHDATACAVHAALYGLSQRGPAEGGASGPALLEFASYHALGDELALGEFIPDRQHVMTEVPLGEIERQRKLELLCCHATQQAVWQAFPLHRENFRVAPRYDFREPPGAPFHYDRVDWGTSGAQFLELARRCLSARGISGRI